MAITLVRIDDRVIHGQLVTLWSKVRPCNGILVIDDAISKDEFRCRVLKAAVPTGIKVGIYDLKEGMEKIALAMKAKNSYFVISNSPRNFAKLLEMGADFGKELNVGPMNSRPNTKAVGKTLFIDDEDRDAFDYIHSKGVNLSFQLVPSETPLTWEKIREKY